MIARSLALSLGGVAVLVLGLTGCGHEDDGGPTGADPVATSSSSGPTRTPTRSPEPTTSPTVTDAIPVDVADLPAGPPPRVDVVVGSTLLHDGEEIALPQGLGLVHPLGTYRGKAYLSSGAQIVTVADDGTLTEVGEPHETYNHFPALVPETGHVLFTVQDRSGPSIVTVMDAVTGEELAVARGADGRASGYDTLEPADRALAEAWDHGGGTDDAGVAARSADGTLEVVTEIPDLVGPPVVLSLQGAPDDGEPSSFAFAYPDPEAVTYDVVLTEQVIIESDRSFLVVAVTGESRDGFDQVVVRCTTDRVCERTTPTATEVQVAGTDLPLPARAR